MGRPRKIPETHTFIAVESGWWKAPDGTEYTFRAGETIIDYDHPLMGANPEWWKPVRANMQRPVVEAATAAPGEMRGDDV